MKRISKVLAAVVLLSLASLLIAAGPKPKAEKCKITGDITSNPETVMIGVNVTGWILTDPAGADAQLYLSENLLNKDEAHGGGLLVPAGLYWGKARVLKGKEDNANVRFDFDFDVFPCEAWGYNDGPPPFPPPLCRYSLIILGGLYDAQNDDVRFDATAQVLLLDGSQTCPDSNCEVGGGEPKVTNNPGILIDFPADNSGDPGTTSESGNLCKNGKDDDGDGLIDCADPDCSTSKFCK